MSNYFMLRDKAIEMGKYGGFVEYVEEREKQGSPLKSRADKK